MEEKTMITRNDVTQAFNRHSKNAIERLFDCVEACQNKGDYILQYWNEKVMIYDTTTGWFISWYKLTHIGRALNTNIDDVLVLNYFVDDLIGNIGEHNERN